MHNRTIILSSEGLKNIVLNECNISEEFKFIFGKKELKIKNVFAEFVSPKVSKLHRNDPTISSIDLRYNLERKCKNLTFDFDTILTDNILSYITKISSGQSIKIKEDEINAMTIVSILLGNSELYCKLCELSHIEIKEENIDIFIQYLLHFDYFSQSSNYVNPLNIINFISSHFYSIDQKKLMILPKHILYSIISNNQLTIESEDSLYDFIQSYFSQNEPEEDEKTYDKNSFYEEINFEQLSESKFQEFIDTLELETLTKPLFNKISGCFYMNYNNIKKRKKQTSTSRYINPSQCTHDQHTRFEFDNNKANSFKGIIHHLTQEAGGNVCDNGVVKVTGSSIFSNSYYAKYVVDFDDRDHYFASENRPNSWLKYDFQKLKIRPTSYSLRTNQDYGEGGQHLRSWVIEGSNTDREDDWKVIDTQTGVRRLNYKNAVVNFVIEKSDDEIESYRYIRIKQTDKNYHNDNLLVVSAFEIFGIVYNQDER